MVVVAVVAAAAAVAAAVAVAVAVAVAAVKGLGRGRGGVVAGAALLASLLSFQAFWTRNPEAPSPQILA